MSNRYEIKEIITYAMLRGYYMGRDKVLTASEQFDFADIHKEFIDNKADVIMTIFEELKKQEATNE